MDIQTINSIRNTIRETNGKFFSIVYENKQGEQNKYVVRTGVKKGVKGKPFGNYCPHDAVTLYAVTKNGKHDEAGFKMMYIDKMKCISFPVEAILNS
jgi:hypothetical protein